MLNIIQSFFSFSLLKFLSPILLKDLYILLISYSFFLIYFFFFCFFLNYISHLPNHFYFNIILIDNMISQIKLNIFFLLIFLDLSSFIFAFRLSSISIPSSSSSFSSFSSSFLLSPLLVLFLLFLPLYLLFSFLPSFFLLSLPLLLLQSFSLCSQFYLLSHKYYPLFLFYFSFSSFISLSS